MDINGGKMKIYSVSIKNFRGIRSAHLVLPDHAVLIGDNNTGKSTVLEAIDLVLGPDRLNRRPPVDEHDFYQGLYLAKVPQPNEENEIASVVGIDTETPVSGEELEIKIEVTVTNLSDEQKRHFLNYIEWLDTDSGKFYEDAKPAGVDAKTIFAALRVTFIGKYDSEEDDFSGNTYFSRSFIEDTEPRIFTKRDKQSCGFLFLRTLRTGSRALSLEHGSLLDIILRLKEIRPQMWEETINTLAEFDVASKPELGISGVLESINTSLKKYVPREWGAQPRLKVSNLTREHLRKIVTAFISTGDGSHAAPFYRQGTGTINMLVLALLSQIAEGKQNVIFAMEEPETAIPPYAQKRIVHELRKLSAQSIFTSHSPYVLEEYKLEDTVILSRSSDGNLIQSKAVLPNNVHYKYYRQEFRNRFCEGLLARRVFIAEGATEAASFPVAARRLEELNPVTYSSVESLGICVIDAGGDGKIAGLAKLFKGLDKQTFALCDKQPDEAHKKIAAEVDKLFMHEEIGIEDLILKNTTSIALERFADSLEWPSHLISKYPDLKTDVKAALKGYFKWSKGNWGIADFLAQCDENEIPDFIRNVCIDLKKFCAPTSPETTDMSMDI